MVIDEVPIGNVSADVCVADCDAEALCGCVTHSTVSGSCFRWMDCQPVLFLFRADTHSDVYLKRQGYSEYFGFQA